MFWPHHHFHRAHQHGFKYVCSHPFADDVPVKKWGCRGHASHVWSQVATSRFLLVELPSLIATFLCWKFNPHFYFLPRLPGRASRFYVSMLRLLLLILHPFPPRAALLVPPFPPLRSSATAAHRLGPKWMPFIYLSIYLPIYLSIYLSIESNRIEPI